MAQFMRMMQFSDGFGGLNAVKMQQSAVSGYFCTANTESFRRGVSIRCAFHFKVQAAFVWFARRCKKQPARRHAPRAKLRYNPH